MPLYYGFYGIDLGYYLVALVALVIGAIAQAYIRSTYKKWSKAPANVPGTGADVARRMLAEGGAGEVGITRVGGSLTDHYDPRDNRLHLSDDNYRGASVASVAVACHEAGHAIQAAEGFGLYRLRSALVPAVNIAQQGWVLVLVLGVMLNAFNLVQLAILLFAVSVVFQLVTLPVENRCLASRGRLSLAERCRTRRAGRAQGPHGCGAHVRGRGAHLNHPAALPSRPLWRKGRRVMSDEARASSAPISVSDAVALAKGAVSAWPTLVVSGEVSGFRGPNARSGHCYFEVKDEGAAMSVIVWRGTAAKMGFQLRDGLTVQLTGRFDVYKASGKLSFVASRVEAAGEGLLRQQVAELARRLEREGLMAQERKRQRPGVLLARLRRHVPLGKRHRGRQTHARPAQPPRGDRRRGVLGPGVRGAGDHRPRSLHGRLRPPRRHSARARRRLVRGPRCASTTSRSRAPLRRARSRW